MSQRLNGGRDGQPSKMWLLAVAFYRAADPIGSFRIRTIPYYPRFWSSFQDYVLIASSTIRALAVLRL